MRAITANDLKTKGVASIAAALREQPEAVISVRGVHRYVVMDLDVYNRLRLCELDAALNQAKQEIADGQGIAEDVEAHIERIRSLDP